MEKAPGPLRVLCALSREILSFFQPSSKPSALCPFPNFWFLLSPFCFLLSPFPLLSSKLMTGASSKIGINDIMRILVLFGAAIGYVPAASSGSAQANLPYTDHWSTVFRIGAGLSRNMAGTSQPTPATIRSQSMPRRQGISFHQNDFKPAIYHKFFVLGP